MKATKRVKLGLLAFMPIVCISMSNFATAQANGKWSGPFFRYNGKVYAKYAVKCDWWRAHDLASSLYFQDGSKRLYGHLATVDNYAENVAVFNGLGAPRGYWLGGYQKQPATTPSSRWTWVTGRPWNYTAWARNEPNDGSGREDGTQDYLRYATTGNAVWDDASGNQEGLVIEFTP